MARKRKTDHDSVIAAAQGLFWHHGYEGASTREIEKQTGLTRFTLQTTYGGKEPFFLQALDAYLDNAEANHFPDPDSFSLDDLAQWFDDIASAEKIPDIEHAGCLAFNSISQFDRTDAEINQRIQRYLTGLESRFAEILARAERQGEVNLRQSAESAAKLLINLLLGIHVVMKARTTDRFAQAYARSAAELIRSWKGVV